MSDHHFLTALRQYLEPLASAPPPPVEEPAISDAWARELLIRTLEQAEAGLPTTPVPGAISLTVDAWQYEDRDVRFVRRLDQLLRDSFAHAATLSERKQMLEVGMCLAVKIPSRWQSEVRTQALLRLAKQAADEVFARPNHQYQDPDEAKWAEELSQLVYDYAVAIRAVRNTAHGEVLTPIGQVFLDLQGRDAVRWLLRLEVHQSTGPRDPMLLDRDFFAGLLHKPNRPRYWSADYETLESDDGPQMERSYPRLQDLGLISTIWDEGTEQLASIHLTSIGTELLTELLQPEHPLALLAAALCSDQLGAAVGKAEGRDRASSMLAAEANARQARAVAHEIRNTLLPVQTQLGLLYKDVQSSLGAETLTKRRAVIDKNLERTFKYVEELVQVATLTAAPPSFFEPRAALLEAVQSAEQPGGPALDVSGVVSPLPVLSGHRERFVLALVNLLRNALQHGGSGTLHVRVSAQPEDGEKWLRITIDDNGSGVPAGEREAIFAQGYSRSSSGTGQGLHIVREVIEGELHGTVTCEDSPLGGARFSLRLPSAGPRSAQKY
ncbi:MAG TPA: HAMP domain-containing sensor histidine kinase [Pseudomonadota bacterium]|nr:HAMP domain-containing sensor histidine kinase [Pseudomonadota bacterium]